MLLHVTHETRYEYAPPVETAQHLAHLKPLATDSQRLVSHKLAIEPPPAQRSEQADLYGNTRAFFALEATHDRLVVTAESVVETSVPVLSPAVARELPWESVRERFRFRKDATFDAASEFVFPSPYVPRHDDFAAYARASFAPGRPAFDVAMDLTERMYADFAYDADSTEINTPAVEALAQRKGVCQDFAHIMIACFRTMGLPARYVSGYLLTQPPPGQPRLVGADASHAWVSVYLPGKSESGNENDGEREGDRLTGAGGWADFDPTNGRQPGEDYVTLAIGRDYSDVSPMRGVLHGGARHTLRVGVTVQPVGEVVEGLAQTRTQSPSQDKESP
ncbi:Transglutaminase-like enzyme, putative cysteine protease [Variovorax sp. OK605]|jgi:transglutaminase-like putative cysteine protease|uniref:transglutaminase family protein n=1 Tax=unclassified Variovorax TaxID=663243 RepID=UPI0008D3B1AC|nr:MULTISPECIES: transglutaminase family protein [unclassified Variovorax]SEK14936.1 Transglutaminase-like enzyme, putative cysteine protease [Variovorax sp. OK202]SFE06598.1 Transglutaminase-like enzyme, putative cysteine protease [Variovorax sp. OK212]SFQ69811.1 Transglutaminase-like enzyme, putative cysteine protease [Variovorax sp. OK605]